MNRFWRRGVFPALILCSAGPQSAFADAFYCGTFTISEGMRSAEIEQKCGAPAVTRVVEDPIYARLDNGATVQVGVDTTYLWYFDRGPNQFVARVTVRDGIARIIRLLTIRDIRDLQDE